jgi:hypothetical protein
MPVTIGEDKMEKTITTLQECLEWLYAERNYHSKPLPGADDALRSYRNKQIVFIDAIRAKLEAGAACAEALKEIQETLNHYHHDPLAMTILERGELQKAITQATASGLIGERK